MRSLAVAGGGGGYYGGHTTGTGKENGYTVGRGANGGSNYINESYFTSGVESKSGINNGNGYIVVTLITK